MCFGKKIKSLKKELAIETGLAKNTITVMLEKMEKNNLIKRITDENDKRKSLVILTEHAKSLKKCSDKISDKMLKKMYKGFSEEVCRAGVERRTVCRSDWRGTRGLCKRRVRFEPD